MDLQNRIPNEAACPVDLSILALLMRATDGVKAMLIAELGAKDRVSLALFCYNRTHLRALAFEILRHCDEFDLHRFASGNGAHLYEQAVSHTEFADNASVGQRPVSLAGRIAC